MKTQGDYRHITYNFFVKRDLESDGCASNHLLQLAWRIVHGPRLNDIELWHMQLPTAGP